MKTIILLLVACFVFNSVSASFTEDEYRSAFTSWMQDMDRAYSSEDFQLRYDIFKSNMDYVEAWNANNGPTVLGMTSLADLTNEEYQRIYLGTHFQVSEREVRIVLPEFQVHAANDSLDWRKSGAVTPIKNQGQCGSCWAFSTTGSVEGVHQLTTAKLVSLSEQNLMDCSTSYGNEGCNGGLMNNAFQYIIANKGIDTEDTYPYLTSQSSCKFNIANVGATITGYKTVSSGSELSLLAAVQKQPVSVAIDASRQSFQLYKSGVYFEPSCSSTNLDHGVLTIGYGLDFTADASGVPYWLVKNSWGTSWGMSGYINMSRNRNNNCGIASMASYPTA